MKLTYYKISKEKEKKKNYRNQGIQDPPNYALSKHSYFHGEAIDKLMHQ